MDEVYENSLKQCNGIYKEFAVHKLITHTFRKQYDHRISVSRQ